MKNFYVDFCSWTVQAESEDEAVNKVKLLFRTKQLLPDISSSEQADDGDDTQSLEYDEVQQTAFPITRLSRADLTSHFTKEQIDKITDDELEYIAGKIGNNCLDCCYWEALKVWTQSVLDEQE